MAPLLNAAYSTMDTPIDISAMELGPAVDCIRAAASLDGHDLFWAPRQGLAHELCVELERRGMVERHDDVDAEHVGWRPCS